MKKAIIALALTGFAASSFAATLPEQSQNLQWNGTVPAAEIDPEAGFTIKQVGTVALDAGILSFTNVAGVVGLESSSTLAFDVISTETVGETVTEGDKLPYDLKITSVKVGKNGDASVEQANEFFQVNHNGAVLAKETVKPVLNTETSSFTITTKAGVNSGLVQDDAVVLQVVAAVTPEVTAY